MPCVQNGSVRIRYAVEGKGACLVLQHGFFGSLEDWYEYGYVDALKDHFRLVMIDARGHGGSGKLRDSTRYALNLRAGDVVRVLDELAVGKAHYMGYSMGGWIGFGLMRWFPERFHSYILAAVHPYESDMSPLSEAINTLEAWVPSTDMTEAHKRRFLQNDKEALLAAVREKRRDNTDLLRDLHVPCLMMDGSDDEIEPRVRAAARLSDRIEYVRIPDADHVHVLFRREFIVPQVLRFLERGQKIWR